MLRPTPSARPAPSMVSRRTGSPAASEATSAGTPGPSDDRRFERGLRGLDSWRLSGLELSSPHNGSKAGAELDGSVFHLRDRMLVFPRARDRTAIIGRGTSV